MSANSDNPSGADNQQETAELAGSSETAREAPTSSLNWLRVKIQSDPHGDMRSQAEMTWPLKGQWQVIYAVVLSSNNSA